MKYRFLAAFFIIAAFSLYSKETYDESVKITLDLDTAVNLALANNLDIKSEKLMFESSKWRAFTSWNVFVPNLTISGTLSRSNVAPYLRNQIDPNNELTVGPPITPDTKSVLLTETKSLWDVSAIFNLSIDFNASMVFNVYQTALDYQNGKINFENAKNTITTSVKKSFYSLILLRNQINISKENISILEKRYAETLLNYKKGFKTEFDFLSSRADYENAKPDLKNKLNDYSKVLLQFKELIGLKKETVIDFIGKIESEKKDFNPDDLIGKYLTNSLTLQSAKNALDIAINSKNSAITALTPTFSIGYLLDPDFQKDPTANSWFGDNNYMEDNWKNQRGAFTLTMSFPLNTLFPFGREQVNIVNSQYNIEVNKVRIQKINKDLKIQVQMLVNDLEKDKETIADYKLTLVYTQMAYDKAEESYKLGRMELLDVQTEENKLENAKFNLLYVEYLYTATLLDLENILNTKLK